MQDVCTGSVRLVFHNDDKTPVEFVISLLRDVFGRTERDATAFASQINRQGKGVCGPYPPPVARALLEEAEQRIQDAGHPLQITSADAADTSDEEDVAFTHAYEALDWHFAGTPASALVTVLRQFPLHMQADVQVALDKLFSSPLGFFGLHEEYRDDLEFAQLLRDGRRAQALAPPQYLEVDIGESAPVKCLRNGLWLARHGELPYAVVLSRFREYRPDPALRIEIAVPAGPAGERFAERCFAELEEAVGAARSYRGKILSFDSDDNYGGRLTGIMVHRLAPVEREQVILPEQTLKLLDRNVLRFIEWRDALRSFGQSTRKGILLYGPPGTGKTHTIRYLATNLPGHTTLIITAAQVALLGPYMSLARLLQPAMVVIEDVDLIARDRNEMGGPCEESLLNKLLNEMDGLKEDADILFVLTTNRPEELESALAGRPGRVDQAIEVPLPDDTGRRKLVRLYGKGLPLDAAVIEDAVRRTKGVSAAFIKELMRRIAQGAIARDAGKSVTSGDIDEALNDMLFAGGRLNVKLLGGAQEMAAE
ncbi:MAG TPA: ATP-dependent Clp protease adaptor ClpS [Bradyrhizobium sp.]|uniref:ATP-dependent Clp protease adaptor ClpS n=1 Tax=Bradyrhizobium sp. TaxID=376 RepID=UPI002D085850|nr:ATP-dependent Clp protease adaptor ClpS [Bradyrhizobium sp.]HLZ04447.1 ATP-dependent Clp protease adaptor ClpS [Bradyrhizobium sp.]